MRQSDIIDDYLDALTRALSFDIPLSCRVRKEVEDHLREAIADEPGGDPIAAQGRAVARLGDPRAIACQYVATSLLAQTRRVGFILIAALAGIYVGMKGRSAWYDFMEWERLTGHLKDVAAMSVSIDHNAFRIALAVGIVGLGYIASRRAPMSFEVAYRSQVTRCVVLSAVTAVALLTSVVADAVITGLRLSAVHLAPAALLPVLSIAAEMALVSALVLHIRTTLRRAASVSSLLRR
jgi:hypothetical protein